MTLREYFETEFRPILPKCPPSLARVCAPSISAFLAFAGEAITMDRITLKLLGQFVEHLATRQYSKVTIRRYEYCIRRIAGLGNKIRPPAPSAEKGTLADYVASYTLCHDITPSTAKQYGEFVRALDKWHGRPVLLTELSDDLINRWITDRLAAGIARPTVKGQRGIVLVLWRAAHDDGLVTTGPRKVRTVKVPAVNPDAWNPDETARLLSAAGKAPAGFKCCSLKRSDLLRAWILVGYYSLLRPCDVRKLKWTDISADGGLHITQQKTKCRIARYLPPDAMDALAAMRTERELVFPVSKDAIEYWFLWLKKQTNLSGSPKWLRRAGATQCEILQPGSAMAALGHKTPGLAYRHYVDARQVHAKPVTPPQIPAPIALEVAHAG